MNCRIPAQQTMDGISRRDFLSRASTSILAVTGIGLWGCASDLISAPSVDGKVWLKDFLPEGFVRDGSASYRPFIQRAIDVAAERRQPLIWEPMTYLIDSNEGLQLRSHSTLDMRGAVLQASTGLVSDGQIFGGWEIRDLEMIGGEISGERGHWHESVNVAGVRLYGSCHNITVRGLYCHDLSSNAIALIGEPPHNRSSNVIVEGLRAHRCCNRYIDYLEPNMGPVDGSLREDQGQITLYNVDNFVVDGCDIVDSHSDNTHFFRCRGGRVTNTRIVGAKMGGYFLEGCENVEADHLTVIGSGSRGVTIERGSSRCTLKESSISDSGREGVWVTDSVDIQILNNRFSNNGVKLDGPTSTDVHITDSSWPSEIGRPRSVNITIADNIIASTAGRYASVRVMSSAGPVIVSGNELTGALKRLQGDAWLSGIGRVEARRNLGWPTESEGLTEVVSNGVQTTYLVPHKLQFLAPSDPRALSYLKVYAAVLFDEPSRLPAWAVSADAVNLVLRFATAPAAGSIRFSWKAELRYPDAPSSFTS
jgi:parallel beta-helix repeat protein